MPKSNKDAWVEKTLEEYEGRLLLYSSKFTGDMESARDIVQEAFIKMLKQDRKKISGYLAPWLFRVCRNLCIDRQRKEKRMTGMNDTANHPSSDPSPEDVLQSKQQNKNLLGLIGKLPAKDQELVRLKFQNGFSYKQIAQITGMSVSNVGYSLHQAVKSLREQALTLNKTSTQGGE